MCLICLQKVPKCAKNKGDQRYIGTLVLCLLFYALCFPLSSTSSMCSNHHVPPSHALLSLNYLQNKTEKDYHVGLS